MNKILCGDCLSELSKMPSDFADMGVTSPPYNKRENKKGWLVKNVKYDRAGDNMAEDDYQEAQIAALNELYRVIKPGGAFFYNHKIRWERGKMLHPMSWLARSRWTVRQEIIWDRSLAANIRGWRFWQVEERIYWLHKPENGNLIGAELKSRHAKLSSIWRFVAAGGNPHPAPFPLVLPLRAIYSLMDERRGVILDPYCGSGTTLVAAKLLGHDYVGIDVSPDYVRMAEERIADCEKERPLCDAERLLHVVRDTFADKKRLKKHVGKFAPAEKKPEHTPARRANPPFSRIKG